MSFCRLDFYFIKRKAILFFITKPFLIKIQHIERVGPSLYTVARSESAYFVMLDVRKLKNCMQSSFNQLFVQVLYFHRAGFQVNVKGYCVAILSSNGVLASTV